MKAQFKQQVSTVLYLVLQTPTVK